jgi:hypothetical protein
MLLFLGVGWVSLQGLTQQIKGTHADYAALIGMLKAQGHYLNSSQTG